jgi:hypothetical protein
MNSLKYIILLSIFILFSCEKEFDGIIENEIIPSYTEVSIEKISGEVGVHRNLFTRMNFAPAVPDLVVKLIFDGIVLDEVQGTVYGSYDFEEQPIPLDQTFIYAEATGYYPSIRKIDLDVPYPFRLHLIPLEYEEFNEHIIEETEPMIRIQANLVPINSRLFVYALNENGQLIGNQWLDPDLAHTIDMAVMAGQKFKLHIRDFFCEDLPPMEFGPFEEDVNLGDIDVGDFELPEFVELTGNNDVCQGYPNTFVFQGDKYKQRASIYSDYTYQRSLDKCSLSDEPLQIVSFYKDPITDDFQSYAKASVDFTANQDLEADLINCAENDLFLKYKIEGGVENEETFLPILASLKTTGETEIYIEMPGLGERRGINILGNSGIHQGQLLFQHNNFPVNTDFDLYYSNNMNFEITLNDGEFVEGTFEGEVVNNEYQSQGVLSGSFRALVK